VCHKCWHQGSDRYEVSEIAIDKANHVWAAFHLPSGVQVLGRYDGIEWQVFDSTNSPLSIQTSISHLTADIGDVVYFASGGPRLQPPFVGSSIVYKYGNGEWEMLNVAPDGLPNSPVQSLAVDGRGNLWFGTYFDGLTRFDGSSWTRFNSTNVPFHPSNNVTAIAATRNGEIWAKGHGWNISRSAGGGYYPGGLVTYDGNIWTTYDESDTLYEGLVVLEIATMVADTHGAIWFGTPSNGAFRHDEGIWSRYDTSNSNIGMISIERMKVDLNGNVWFFGPKITKYDGKIFSVILDTIPFPDLKGIDISLGGTIWAATDEFIWKYENPGWSSYRLPVTGVSSFAVDNHGTVWVGTAGVYSFNGVYSMTYHTFNSGLGYEFITGIVIDSHNNKYFIGQDYGGGVTVFNATGITLVEKEKDVRTTAPLFFSLSQNFPNPFNPSTTINYALPFRGSVKLSVFNVLGQQIETLVDDIVDFGDHEVAWNAFVSSGVYFYRLEAVAVGDPSKRFVDVKKMILVK